MLMTRRIVAWLSLSLVAHCTAGAVELLTDGGFEFGVSIPEWTLEESIFDLTTQMPRDFGQVNSAQQSTFSPISGTQNLWLRAFVGGQAPGPDTVTNASLWQIVPAVAGETYNLTGQSRWEDKYSGGVTTLVANGPLGAVPSPTETTLELAFLDAGGAVLGTPAVLDLRNVQSNFNFWVEHDLSATAPAGTVSVRVTAAAEQMVWNGGAPESAFFDDFSLTTDSDPMTELLLNADLEDTPGPFDPAYTIVEVPGGNIPNDPTVSTRDFANRPDSGGQLGVWLRSFTGSTGQPADATVSQTVPGVPGGDYTFTAWSNFQPNYPGGLPGFPTETMLELAFLDAGGAEIGAPLTLDVANEQMNDATWREHTLNGTAPTGTVSVRVSGMGLDMVTNPAGGQQSAFLDDFSLVGPGPGLDGDFDGDGDVDVADALLWQRNGGDPTELADWQAGFGAGEALTAASGGRVSAVPEPAGVLLLLSAGFAMPFVLGRRHRSDRLALTYSCQRPS